MKTITIEVEEIDNSGRFAVWIGDRYLLTSDAPFLSAARLLLEQGFRPTSRLQMRRRGCGQIDLSGQLGAAAGLRVTTDATGKPIFDRHPDARETTATASPMRQNEEAA